MAHSVSWSIVAVSTELRSLPCRFRVCAWYVLVRSCYPALWSALAPGGSSRPEATNKRHTGG
ncbi:hypothetical protein FOMPIDRAFT_1022262, partial [Fomitopsis schrenkii]